jgi:uncharacterized protein with PIN domain/sulfur carrier protein ThiS
MAEAHFRFYAELNDFLLPEDRFREQPHRFAEGATVKDRIESLGIPHTEVDLILVNGASVDFDYRVRDGDRVSVYPVFEAFDIGPVNRLRPEPLREPRFILDTHLGRLAAYLRMTGFDTLYRNCYHDEQLARISADEHRILLTRDIGLLKRSAVTHGYFVRETDSRKQLDEVIRKFDLGRRMRPFTRCMACNAPLERVEKADVGGEIPPSVAAVHEEFQRCPRCRRIYWQGGHYRRMQRLVESLGLY